jgi:hypothetical protein
MRQRTLWLAMLALAASALVLVAVPSGCASGAAGMPQIKTSVTVAPKLHMATIHISANGEGKAFAGIVLSYPDGHRDLLGTATYSAASSGTWEPNKLPSGSYAYTVYATLAGPNDTGSFPVGMIVKANVVASGTFVIP